jgi:DNA invertase Pin-like site-specific DNA recombinase
MLSKQSIRKEHTILLNRIEMSKDEIIEISKDFTENEEQRFRKMLKQGGTFTMQGKEFEIKRTENKWRNSKGEYETAAKPHRKEDWE